MCTLMSLHVVHTGATALKAGHGGFADRGRLFVKGEFGMLVLLAAFFSKLNPRA